MWVLLPFCSKNKEVGAENVCNYFEINHFSVVNVVIYIFLYAYFYSERKDIQDIINIFI